MAFATYDEAYRGTAWAWEEPKALGFTINGKERQKVKLRHYRYDIRSLLPGSRDDASRKGMELYMQLALVLLYFVRDGKENVIVLEWDLQAGSCEGPTPGLAKAMRPI